MATIDSLLETSSRRVPRVLKRNYPGQGELHNELLVNLLTQELHPDLEKSIAELLRLIVGRLKGKATRQTSKFKQLPESFNPAGTQPSPQRIVQAKEILQSCLLTAFECAALKAESGDDPENRGFSQFVKRQKLYGKSEAYRRWDDFRNRLQKAAQ